MPNAKELLKNRNDKYLNVFWSYDGKPTLENNVTKAFINTIDSLSLNDKKRVFAELFDYTLPEADISFNYYLQKVPDESIRRSLTDSQKLLFAFNPTKKCWGHVGIDKNNEKEIRKSIKVSLTEYYTDLSEEEIEKKVEEQFNETINKIIKRGDSRPDAWILICKNETPVFCIAMENKLYDLDPFQLNNHCEKSLFLDKGERKIKYCSYSEILNLFDGIDSFLAKEFIRYMYLLKYWTIDNLSQTVGMDDDNIDFYAQKRVKQLLKDVSGKEVSRHRGWMDMVHSDNPYNKEIGLKYDNEKRRFELPLYFGTNQNICRKMYSDFKERGYSIASDLTYKNSFHFQFKGIRKNAPSYYDSDTSIEQYINFWIDNVDSIRQIGKEERHILLDKMLAAGIIPKIEYDKIRKFSDSYDKPLNVVPEIGVYYWLNIDDAIRLDTDKKLVSSIKDVIKRAYAAFG